ncbi:MAG: hypothetical protein PHD48_10365 [Alphaproteobacteria bacterium]|nr:hypothetical protein [Alphaproteobacteria bacterium]
MTPSLRLLSGTVALLLCQFIFLVLYLGQEQAIPFWDYAMYANMAIDWFSAPTGTEMVSRLFQSLSQKYNLLFAVPSLLSFSVFGATRSVFILTNFLIYFVVYQLAVGFVFKQIFQEPWPKTFFLSALLCCVVPFIWYPLFQGYPDHSAALCLTLAIGFALKPSSNHKTFLATGLLLGLSILLRRHYAYPALAVLLTIGITESLEAAKQKQLTNRKWLFQKVISYGLAGAGLLGVLILCEPTYLREILVTDYTTLYKSYERPPCYFVLFAFSHVGLCLLALSLAGYGMAAYLFPAYRRGLFFTATLMIIWLVLWAEGPGQAGDHYLISVLPLFCLTGLWGLFRSLHRQRRLRPVLALCGVFLAINSVQAFWLAPFELPSQKPSFSFWSAPRPPWVRKDKDELKRLAHYIGTTTTALDKVVVVGSSFIFNQDLMRALYTEELHTLAPAYRFLQAPESDGEQDPPLDVYASGTVFLVATPTQYHLPMTGQRVITGLSSRFPPTGTTEAFFEKDPQSFSLDKKVQVEIWRRTKAWQPGNLYENLYEIRNSKDMPRRWVAQKMAGRINFGKDENHQNVGLIAHGAGPQASVLFYDSPLDPGTYRIVTRVRLFGGCEKVHLTALVQNENGQTLSKETVPVYQIDDNITLPFSFLPMSTQKKFLSLMIKTETQAAPCTVALEQLRLQQSNIQGLP